jgi:hypothetical protein
VIIDVNREERRATLTIRWKGGALTELAVPLAKQQPKIRSDEDTIALLTRLAAHYDDATIAAILNRQGRRSARGERFTAIIVGGLRRHRGIPAYKPPPEPPDGELLPIGKAAEELGVAASTIHRWLQAGFIAGEQDTPSAPWRIRVNDELRALFVEDAPAGYVPILDAMRILGVSRQTVLQRVKRGELDAIHVRNGRRKGLRIQVILGGGSRAGPSRGRSAAGRWRWRAGGGRRSAGRRSPGLSRTVSPVGRPALARAG